MNPLWFYHILKTGLSLVMLLVAAATLIVLWRLRGVLQWKRSLKHEFRELKDQLNDVSPSHRKALLVVLDRCEGIWKAGFPELSELYGLSEYIQLIAFAFHPDQENPELCITTGTLIRISTHAVQRIQDILCRPGFTRLQHIRIRHIRKARQWFNKISNHRLIQTYIRYRRWINRANLLRLILLPDPFSWLIYLSNQLTILSMTRFFLMDIYLFIGQQAILAYNHEIQQEVAPQNTTELEEELTDLAELVQPEPFLLNPEIQEIRNRLVGFNTLFFHSADISDWKRSFIEALQIISRTHFPDSPEPAEEAVLHSLLERCQYWLQSISNTETLPIIRKLHRIEIRYFYNAKSAVEHPLFRQTGFYAKKSLDIYNWMQWPLMIYRLVNKATPAGMAVSIGWILVKKGTVNYLSRKTFDLTIQEMDMIYRLSRNKISGNHST